MRAGIATLLLSSALPRPLLAQTVSFGAPTHISVGSSPQWVAVADFNGDGAKDLAVANAGSGTVSVLLGNGDGTFQPPQHIPVSGQGPSCVIAVDVNGDAVTDLVTTNGNIGPSSDDISVLLGNGNGTFQAPSLFPSGGTKPNFGAAGDFNGDGAVDLAVATFNNGSGSTFSTLRGNGNGTFQSPAILTAQVSPIWVAASDLDGDDTLDLVTANFRTDMPSTVSVFKGNGDGTFQAASHYAAGATGTSGPAAVAIGNFNNDGLPDVAIPNYGASGSGTTLTVLLGTGAGAFGAPQTYAVGRSPLSVTIADFDGDGVEDLAIPNFNQNSGSTFSVLLGNGDGTFQLQQVFNGGQGIAAVAAADFDGDGKLDVATANYAAGTITVLLNTTAPPASQTLTVDKTGTGSGTVTSSPAGINCGSDCTESYGPGSVVTLTAAAAGGSTFTGWSGGGCSGTGNCVVVMASSTTVTANFDLAPQGFPLTVGKAGSGSGTVTSNPAGIDCGSDCSESYASGTVVTLIATPAAGSTFAGWSGACSGTGPCNVSMTAARSVTATFSPLLFTLTVTKQGLGLGTVGSTPAGIDCGTLCTSQSASFAYGTVVTLSATPALSPLSAFDGWGGACSGTGPCTITITSNTSVTARFRLLGLF
jgi:hypothetical protein